MPRSLDTDNTPSNEPEDSVEQALKCCWITISDRLRWLNSGDKILTSGIIYSRSELQRQPALIDHLCMNRGASNTQLIDNIISPLMEMAEQFGTLPCPLDAASQRQWLCQQLFGLIAIPSNVFSDEQALKKSLEIMLEPFWQIVEDPLAPNRTSLD